MPNCYSVVGEEAVGDSVPSPACRRRCSTTARAASRCGSSQGSCSPAQTAGRKTLGPASVFFFFCARVIFFLVCADRLSLERAPQPLLERTDSLREKREETKKLACHLSPSRSLAFLPSAWAPYVSDGWLASKGLCCPCVCVCVSYIKMYAKNLRYPETFVRHVHIPVVPHSDAFTSHV